MIDGAVKIKHLSLYYFVSVQPLPRTNLTAHSPHAVTIFREVSALPPLGNCAFPPPQLDLPASPGPANTSGYCSGGVSGLLNERFVQL